ncbi:hypothetical protein AB832_05030 [Flavobacteriaceae bacterium (ex Bugula neritina AB1)]|nr:hypothetical protein AB832_05030 [Flavobacteriaceae bacterium (ex Bugula neritina AB1)]
MYNKIYAEEAFDMASKGCTEAEIAEALNISWDTFLYWKRTHIDFLVMIKNGKDYYRDSMN